MFEMQVRCVWVITRLGLISQQIVNLDMYICRFLTIRFPLNLAPKCRKWHFRDSRFQNFQGGIPPDRPRNLSPLALDFRAYGARKLVTKILRSTPDLKRFTALYAIMNRMENLRCGKDYFRVLVFYMCYFIK